MEPDQPGPTDAERGCAEIAGRAEHGLLQHGRIGRVLFQIEGDQLLALGDDDGRGVGEQGREVTGREALLAGIDRLTDGDVPTLEEGVGTLAARSALAVVSPVDALGHGGELGTFAAIAQGCTGVRFSHRVATPRVGG